MFQLTAESLFQPSSGAGESSGVRWGLGRHVRPVVFSIIEARDRSRWRYFSAYTTVTWTLTDWLPASMGTEFKPEAVGAKVL